MTLASQEINAAKCELFERGWSQSGPTGSDGQVCVMVALALGRGLTEHEVLMLGRWADPCESAKHVYAAIEELHGEGWNPGDDAVHGVYRWNDRGELMQRKFDEVIEVLDLAEKKALIAEEKAVA